MFTTAPVGGKFTTDKKIVNCHNFTFENTGTTTITISFAGGGSITREPGSVFSPGRCEIGVWSEFDITVNGGEFEIFMNGGKIQDIS